MGCFSAPKVVGPAPAGRKLPPKHNKHKIKSAFEAAQPETPTTDSSSEGERLGDYNSSSLGSLSSGASSLIPAGFSGTPDNLSPAPSPKRERSSRKADDQVSSVRARYASHSRPGFALDLAEKENQDAWFCKEFPQGKDALVFGVLDGHGVNGGVLSQTLSKLLPDMLTNCDAWKAGDFKGALASRIPACAEVVRNYGIDCSMSGSTAVIAVLQSNCKLTVANLGDCRCFIGGMCKDGQSYSIPLTTDHTLAEPAEELRIRDCKGWIGRCMSDGKPVGPKRMYLPQQNVPGLALTRAIGDFVAADIGLSAEPDIIEYQVRRQDRYLVVCSDGLFEFMSNKRIIGKIHKLAAAGLPPQEIASRLVSEARERWIKQDGRFVDDCTCIVVLLDRPLAKSPSLASSPSGKPAPSLMRSASNLSRSAANLVGSLQGNHRSPTSMSDTRLTRTMDHASNSRAFNGQLMDTTQSVDSYADEPPSPSCRSTASQFETPNAARQSMDGTGRTNSFKSPFMRYAVPESHHGGVSSQPSFTLNLPPPPSPNRSFTRQLTGADSISAARAQAEGALQRANSRAIQRADSSALQRAGSRAITRADSRALGGSNSFTRKNSLTPPRAQSRTFSGALQLADSYMAARQHSSRGFNGALPPNDSTASPMFGDSSRPPSFRRQRHPSSMLATWHDAQPWE